jgi:protocatechuate 3,4-dioxygenase beta subunit
MQNKLSPSPEHTLPAEEEHHEWCPRLDRRVAMRLLGYSALATIAGCGTTSSSSDSSSGTTATTTTLTSSASSVEEGVKVTLTAAVSPAAATGKATFYDGTTSLGSSTLSSGSTTLSTSFTTTGTHSLTAVYGGDTTYAGSTSSAISIAVTAGTATCTETLEGEEGPYFVDDSDSGYNRSNILTSIDGTDSQTGVSFVITLYVYDSENSCAAMEGVQVDIWHCNASGIYSAESSESTTGESWLRGYQITDSSGKVQFTTIIPGWYSGRTTHIHFRLRSSYDSSSSGGTNTMQVFFDQTLIDTLATSVSPYSAEGTNPTTNATDRVYADQEDGTTLLTLSGSTTEGYTASFSVALPIKNVS